MKFCALLITASLLPLQAHAQNVVSNQTALNTAIASLHSAAVNTDKFAEPAKIAIIGQTFKITLAPKTSAYGNFSYDYKDGHLVFDLSPASVFPKQSNYHLKAIPAIVISDNSRVTGHHIGQNAFGMTARVSDVTGSGFDIAVMDAPKAMLSPMNSTFTRDVMPDTDWWISVDLPPASAKAMAADVVAVIEGTYTNIAPDKAGECDTRASAATIDTPITSMVETCYVGAAISRIAFVKRSTGEVLREWTLANAPRLGATLWHNVKLGMTRDEVDSAEPTMKGGYSDTEHVLVEFKKNVVSSVNVSAGALGGKPLLVALTARYSKPVFADCITPRMCEAKWIVSPGVAMYQTITGMVYQSADAPPPVGFDLR